MNKTVNSTFRDIHNAFARHQASVTATLSTYRSNVERATQEAAAFKDEAGELKRRKDALISSARSEIMDADKSFSDGLKLLYIPALRSALSGYVCELPQRDFVALLRDFQDFHIKLSRMEAEALVEQAKGNYAALRMLQAVAKESGFHVTAPTAQDYMDDLAKLEKAARVPTMWSPRKYLHEAVEVLPDRPVFRADGSLAYSGGRPDPTFLLAASTELDQVYANVTATGERWGNAFVPSVSQFEPLENPETGETITLEQQRDEAEKDAASQVTVSGADAVDLARKIGQEQAEGHAKAAEAIEHFKV